jgi:predicted methyltransferase MtxX (methanogen marker protein 4)
MALIQCSVQAPITQRLSSYKTRIDSKVFSQFESTEFLRRYPRSYFVTFSQVPVVSSGKLQDVIPVLRCDGVTGDGEFLFDHAKNHLHVTP